MKRIKRILSAALMLVFIVSTAAVETNAETVEEENSVLVSTTATINGKSIKELSDGDRDTVYDIGGTVVEIDLTEETEIDSISVYTDDEQTPQFVAEVSLDKTEWSVAVDYQNSNIDMDNFKLNGITAAKFIRFRFFNDSLLCSGIEVYKKENIEFIEKDNNIEVAAKPTLYRHQFNDSQDTAYEQECEFLAFLGIIDGKQEGLFKGEDYLTRAEFAKLAVNALNLSVIDMSEPVFNDVDSSNALSDYIYTAYTNHIVSGYEDGTFRPDDRVLCQEAYVMVCRLLNYDKVIDREAAYPYNYIGKLSEEVSLKKIRKGYGEPMTRGEAAILICNALHAVPYFVNNIKGNTGKYEKDTKTVLESTREIYLRSGVLDAVDQNSIYYIPSLYEKGTVVIGGNKYYYDTDRLTPSYFIGTKVEYYIDNSDDSEYCVFMLHSKNNPNIVNFDVEDVDEITAEYITAGENGRKKIKIADQAMMMYNGMSYGLYKNSFNDILDKGYGYIKLVDNDYNNIYDVVQYTNYVNEEVKLADEKKGILQTESFKIDLNDIDIACRIYQNGLEAGISDIKKGDILSISESKNTEGLKCYDIYIASKKISNIVLDSYADGTREVKLGNTVYKLADELASPGISDNVVIGKNLDLLIDGFGRICRIAPLNADDDYSYLVCAYEDDPDEGKLLTVGLDTQKREISCEFPISVDIGGQTSKCKSVSELKALLTVNNDGREDQLIKYRTNSDGKVKRIEIASQTVNESKFSMDYKSASAKYKWAVSEWDYEYKVDNNTRYLIVPDDIRDYNKYKTKPTLNGDDTYNIKMYDVNDRRVASVVVMYGEKGGFIPDHEKALFLVSNIKEGLDDDDNIVKILTGYKNNKEMTIYEPYENAFENIAVGDTMNVVLDSDGNLFTFKPVTGDTSTSDEFCHRLTTVEDINYTEVKDSWRWYDLQNVGIYIVDRDNSRNKITKGTIGDIEIGDKILISIVNYYVNMVIVYKDM